MWKRKYMYMMKCRRTDPNYALAHECTRSLSLSLALPLPLSLSV